MINSRRQRGFTLIELLIVILILGVLFTVLTIAAIQLFGDSEKKATEATLLSVGSSGFQTLETNGQLKKLLKPSSLASLCGTEFENATGMRGAKDYRSLKPLQRAKVLAFVIAPTLKQWEKIVDPKKLSENRYSSLIDEQQAKFLSIDTDGFNYVADAWENPVSYEFVKSAGAGGKLNWVIFSGGPDGDLATFEDNLNYSLNGGNFEGKHDKEQ